MPDKEQVQTRTLHFSVQGKMITDLAREKLYYDNNLPYAIDLLMSCMETDQISKGDRLLIAVQILNGEKEIVGTYPGDDYGIQDCKPTKNQKTITSWCESLSEELAQLKAEKNELIQKLICIGENLSEWDRTKINTAWRTEYDGTSRYIFDDPGSRALERANAVLSGLSGFNTNSDPVQDFLDRMTDPHDEDYGWLEPNGTFHAADWGHHQTFAREWLEKHDPDFNPTSKEYYAPGDVLVNRGWVLLHNPSQGLAFITKSDTRPLTKAQQNYLFDYYTERNHPEKASEYLEQE